MEFCTSDSAALASNQTDLSSPQQSWMPSRSVGHQLILPVVLVESTARLDVWRGHRLSSRCSLCSLLRGLIGWRLIQHHLIAMIALCCPLTRLTLCNIRYIGHVHMTQAAGRKIMENPGDSIGVRKSVSQDFCRRLGLQHHRQILLLRCRPWSRHVAWAC